MKTKRLNLEVDRGKWLRGSASHLMHADGCGCIIGHYLVAKGIPPEKLLYRYSLDTLERFADRIWELGEFESDEGKPYFNMNFVGCQMVGVNDGDPRSVHDQHVAPVDNDQRREAVLIRLMKELGCKLKFTGS